MTGTNNTLGKNAENCEGTLNSTAKVRANGNSDEHDYVNLFRNTFDRSLFPSDFDEWTVCRRYAWINDNLSKFYPNVPESLLNFIPAFFCQEDCGRSPVEKPEWLDMNKYRRGQKFVQDNFTGITMTIILSLLPAYTFDGNLSPIILSDRTHTPYLAFKRYLSTMCRMMNWFTGDPWTKGTPAFKDMQVVRKMHKVMRAKLSRLNNHEVDDACKFENPWCPDRELLLKDFAEACPFEKIGQRPYKSFVDLPFKRKYINNAEMAMIQCCFVGFILLYPQEFGVHDATDEDFEAFCHIWRCYGYYLGMEDEYNFCRGSLEEIKQRLRDFYQYWMIPNLKEVTPEWEHMTRCVVEPFNYFPMMYMSYKSAVLLVTDLFDISMPRLHASLSYADWIAYKIWKFVLRYALKLSSLRLLFNKVVLNSLNKMVNCSPEKEMQIHVLSKKETQDFSITF
ncbi:PREDICTED: uncharacterized protein LOC105455080 [Wasmannia auropunctata]|uniref:uncharacterized protein LOC105455080 n=1 Tax=Wasmannia auropunctata TaxID=64793 RepID=UPI0005ED9FD7|nr:PREDICTED: uncharacterized protein LOC105455080 [Wasmannia auropunctata]